jgi:hypothetical protein
MNGFFVGCGSLRLACLRCPVVMEVLIGIVVFLHIVPKFASHLLGLFLKQALDHFVIYGSSNFSPDLGEWCTTLCGC